MDADKLYTRLTALLDDCDDAIIAVEADRRDPLATDPAKRVLGESFYRLREAYGQIADARRTVREYLRT